MKQDDLKEWMRYSKTIKRIKAVDVLPVLPARCSVKIQPLSRAVARLIDNRPSFSRLSVENLDRPSRRRFSAEARIDLHGYSMDVNNTLEAFCAKCILLGLRNVVITTGKGGGVVKNATLTWLKSNPKYVVGFFEIMDARGESGAIGVHLRRM